LLNIFNILIIIHFLFGRRKWWI